MSKCLIYGSQIINSSCMKMKRGSSKRRNKIGIGLCSFSLLLRRVLRVMVELLGSDWTLEMQPFFLVEKWFLRASKLNSPFWEVRVAARHLHPCSLGKAEWLAKNKEAVPAILYLSCSLPLLPWKGLISSSSCCMHRLIYMCGINRSIKKQFSFIVHPCLQKTVWSCKIPVLNSKHCWLQNPSST